MNPPVFFNESFIGKIVGFEQMGGLEWTITEKLSEKFVQYDSRDPGARSYAWAVFSCSEAAAPSHRATVKVFMQVPRVENMLETSEERAKEAKKRLCDRAETEKEVHARLSPEAQSFASRLLATQSSIQDDRGLVPGGYMFFMLFEEVVGDRLSPGLPGMSAFWTKDFEARELIRAQFKAGWLELRKVGVDFSVPCPDNLVYDEGRRQLLFVDFDVCLFVEPSSEWDSYELVAWGVGEAPS